MCTTLFKMCDLSQVVGAVIMGGEATSSCTSVSGLYELFMNSQLKAVMVSLCLNAALTDMYYSLLIFYIILPQLEIFNLKMNNLE